MISLLVPVYNTQQYLSRCLNSICQQTYRDLEIICIDDGSTDLSGRILDNFASTDSRIRVVHQKNQGIGAVRNQAMRMARGEFILFVDADDFLEKNMVEILYTHALESGSDIVQCDYTMDYRFGKLRKQSCGNHILDQDQALDALSRGKFLTNYPWGKLIRRSCLLEMSFPERLKGFEDTFTLFKALLRAQKVETISERLYHYVQRRGSITNRMSLDTVYQMRMAFEYQQIFLSDRFPGRHFDYTRQFYNCDMVIIYTLIVFGSRKRPSVFIPGKIQWDMVPWIFRLAYQVWLKAAKIRLGKSLRIQKTVILDLERFRKVQSMLQEGLL